MEPQRRALPSDCCGSALAWADYLLVTDLFAISQRRHHHKFPQNHVLRSDLRALRSVRFQILPQLSAEVLFGPPLDKTIPR